MSAPIAQTILATLVTFFLWRILRTFFAKSPLAIIDGPPRTSWWKGHMDQLYDLNGWNFHTDIISKYGTVVKVNGLFGNETLYVSDPRALHNIVVKDQYIYEETNVFLSNNALIFGTSLLSTLGDHHKRQRKMLNPLFSLKHMRNLVPTFYPIAHKLREIITSEVEKGAEEVEVMRWLSRAALEYIGQGGLGYSFGKLDDVNENKYRDAIHSLTPLLSALVLPQQFTPHIVKFGTPWLRRKVLDWIPVPMFQNLKRVVDVMDNTSAVIYKGKKSAFKHGEMEKQTSGGNDIMSTLLKANSTAKEEDQLPEHEVIGQINTFILAGHDTTTSAITRILDVLVAHPAAQDKLREEVRQARKEHGDMDYDTLMSLPYLDAVCRETLRLHPPVPTLTRTAKKDVTLPLLWPIKAADGKTMLSEIPLKSGTGIIISIIGANKSKAIWGEDAEEWRPERWLEPLPESVSQAHLPGVYSSMMTFLGGGRACIGFKFSELEMKIVLSVLLETLSFARASKEIEWKMGGLHFPMVKGESGIHAQLPLKVKLMPN